MATKKTPAKSQQARPRPRKAAAKKGEKDCILTFGKRGEFTLGKLRDEEVHKLALFVDLEKLSPDAFDALVQFACDNEYHLVALMVSNRP